MNVVSAPRRAPGLLLALLLALALAPIGPLSARGHADLLSSDPSAGQILAEELFS